jgi:hypothetical protein
MQQSTPSAPAESESILLAGRRSLARFVSCQLPQHAAADTTIDTYHCATQDPPADASTTVLAGGKSRRVSLMPCKLNQCCLQPKHHLTHLRTSTYQPAAIYTTVTHPTHLQRLAPLAWQAASHDVSAWCLAAVDLPQLLPGPPVPQST